MIWDLDFAERHKIRWISGVSLDVQNTDFSLNTVIKGYINRLGYDCRSMAIQYSEQKTRYCIALSVETDWHRSVDEGQSFFDYLCRALEVMICVVPNKDDLVGVIQTI